MKILLVFCILTVAGFFAGVVYAASGKCTVVKVDGVRMVIECNKNTKGFSKGNKIKIKTDRKKASGKKYGGK